MIDWRAFYELDFGRNQKVFFLFVSRFSGVRVHRCDQHLTWGLVSFLYPNIDHPTIWSISGKMGGDPIFRIWFIWIVQVT